MRHEGNTVYVSDEDAASLEKIADEYGMAPRLVEQLLELNGSVTPTEVLRPRVAAVFRLQLENLGAVRR